MKKLLCWIFNHRLITVEKLFGSYKLLCTRCQRTYGMHDKTRTFLPWDRELEEMHIMFKKYEENKE